MSGYEKVRELAKETGAKIPDLLAMARQNDPFFMGSPAQVRDGEWFAGLWEEYSFHHGVHLRRVHYRHVSNPEATGPNGEPYNNTENHWNTLCNAGKYARYLGLVDPDAFVDRRNPEPHIYMFAPESEPGWEYSFEEWSLPEIPTRLPTYLDMPEFYATGYDYEPGLQRYHLEVWCEKSTMDDELMPLCEEHATNLITGVGEMSITSIRHLLARVAELGKPCRLLYISDFDPAGGSMPVAVARKIEHEIGEMPLSDIRLQHLILTAAQARDYELPRTPIKEKEKRRDKFEALHGEGATELDALEALRPGELARLVEETIQDYRDPHLPRRVRTTAREAQEELESGAEIALGGSSAELSRVRSEVEAIARSYEQRLAALDAELQAELEPYRERVESLRLAVQEALDDFEPLLPELPEPSAAPETDGWLFDSARDYMDQLVHYKRHQRGE